MAEYEFRVRFNLANAYRINSEAEKIDLLALPAGVGIKLLTGLSGTPIKDHARASVRGGPFFSIEEARAAAEKTKHALLYWSVEQRLGIDLGDGRQRSIVTKAGLALLQEQFQFPIRNDTHGIDVYERVDNIKFVSLNADFHVGKHPGGLVQSFEREFVCARRLTDKQILASEIYSASFFDVSHRSRFITLVTAVEALLEPVRRSESVQALIGNMEFITRESAIDESTKEAIVSNLQWLRDDSIGESGRTLSRRLLPDRRYDNRSSWAFFTLCYNLRSQMLHRGKVEDPKLDMLSFANTLEGFVSDLLLASLREST